MPIVKHTTDTIVTDLNFLHSHIDVITGNIMTLDISNAPIILMPSTIVIAIDDAKSILYTYTLVPVVLIECDSEYPVIEYNKQCEYND